MNSTKKVWLTTFGILLASGIALAQTAGDRIIKNPTQDKDVIIQVNKGGTTVDAFKVFGATGVASPTIAANIRSSEGAGTTTLTIADAPHQIFNLSAARTVRLPTTGVKAGYQVTLENRGAFDLDVESSNTNSMTLANGANSEAKINKGKVVVVALQDAPTTPAHWRVTSLYEEGSFATDSTLTGTVKYTRNLNWVLLHVDVTHSSAGGASTNTGNVPARLRPIPSTFINNIVIITGAPQYADRIEVGHNGQISVTHYTWDSTGTTNSTAFRGTVTYSVL